MSAFNSTPATGTFKVGDRVRYGEHLATVREYKPHIHGGPYLIEFDDDVGFGHTGNGMADTPLAKNRGWWVKPDFLAPATLTIREGRYYKTRDGRRVGPMRHEGWSDGEPWTADHWSRYWTDKGGRVVPLNEPDDLIAEWPSDDTAGFTVPICALEESEIAAGDWVKIEGRVSSVDGETVYVDIPGLGIRYNRSYPRRVVRAA